MNYPPIITLHWAIKRKKMNPKPLGSLEIKLLYRRQGYCPPERRSRKKMLDLESTMPAEDKKLAFALLAIYLSLC